LSFEDKVEVEVEAEVEAYKIKEDDGN